MHLIVSTLHRVEHDTKSGDGDRSLDRGTGPDPSGAGLTTKHFDETECFVLDNITYITFPENMGAVNRRDKSAANRYHRSHGA